MNFDQNRLPGRCTCTDPRGSGVMHLRNRSGLELYSAASPEPVGNSVRVKPDGVAQRSYHRKFPVLNRKCELQLIEPAALASVTQHLRTFHAKSETFLSLTALLGRTLTDRRHTHTLGKRAVPPSAALFQLRPNNE